MAERRQLGPQPPQVTGPAPVLGHSDYNSPEAILMRFGGGLVGQQEPGDLPSALGSMASLLPIEKLLRLLGTAQKGEKALGVGNLGDSMLRNHELDSRISGLPPTAPNRPTFPEPPVPTAEQMNSPKRRKPRG